MVKESVAFIAGHQVGSSGQLVLKKPELNSKSLKGFGYFTLFIYFFGKAFLKAKWGGGGGSSWSVWSVHAQLSDWLMVK